MKRARDFDVTPSVLQEVLRQYFTPHAPTDLPPHIQGVALNTLLVMAATSSRTTSAHQHPALLQAWMDAVPRITAVHVCHILRAGPDWPCLVAHPDVSFDPKDVLRGMCFALRRCRSIHERLELRWDALLHLFSKRSPKLSITLSSEDDLSADVQLCKLLPYVPNGNTVLQQLCDAQHGILEPNMSTIACALSASRTSMHAGMDLLPLCPRLARIVNFVQTELGYAGDLRVLRHLGVPGSVRAADLLPALRGNADACVDLLLFLEAEMAESNQTWTVSLDETCIDIMDVLWTRWLRGEQSVEHAAEWLRRPGAETLRGVPWTRRNLDTLQRHAMQTPLAANTLRRLHHMHVLTDDDARSWFLLGLYLSSVPVSRMWMNELHLCSCCPAHVLQLSSPIQIMWLLLAEMDAGHGDDKVWRLMGERAVHAASNHIVFTPPRSHERDALQCIMKLDIALSTSEICRECEWNGKNIILYAIPTVPSASQSATQTLYTLMHQHDNTMLLQATGIAWLKLYVAAPSLPDIPWMDHGQALLYTLLNALGHRLYDSDGVGRRSTYLDLVARVAQAMPTTARRSPEWTKRISRQVYSFTRRLRRHKLDQTAFLMTCISAGHVTRRDVVDMARVTQCSDMEAWLERTHDDSIPLHTYVAYNYMPPVFLVRVKAMSFQDRVKFYTSNSDTLRLALREESSSLVMLCRLLDVATQKKMRMETHLMDALERAVATYA